MCPYPSVSVLCLRCADYVHIGGWPFWFQFPLHRRTLLDSLFVSQSSFPGHSADFLSWLERIVCRMPLSTLAFQRLWFASSSLGVRINTPFLTRVAIGVNGESDTEQSNRIFVASFDSDTFGSVATKAE